MVFLCKIHWVSQRGSWLMRNASWLSNFHSSSFLPPVHSAAALQSQAIPVLPVPISHFNSSHSTNRPVMCHLPMCFPLNVGQHPTMAPQSSEVTPPAVRPKSSAFYPAESATCPCSMSRGETIWCTGGHNSYRRIYALLNTQVA